MINRASAVPIFVSVLCQFNRLIRLSDISFILFEDNFVRDRVAFARDKRKLRDSAPFKIYNEILLASTICG